MGLVSLISDDKPVLLLERKDGTDASVPLIQLTGGELKGVLRSLMSRFCEGSREVLVKWDEMDGEN